MVMAMLTGATSTQRRMARPFVAATKDRSMASAAMATAVVVNAKTIQDHRTTA
jgi:hypothetical protein